ncbi:4'-phosphopantetheinyl transferase family protein [Priestia megaterium]|uniref:4'-phosphopantetheinyl transferase family protein n=1 Tax=Priestia megaterium TaxID=1404 RepID=UPI001FB53231|nr:4'-phosphopantetheinyl transferase superfamily protein [Priestia megaterium]
MDIFLINIGKITEKQFNEMAASIDKNILKEISAIKIKQERDRRIASSYFLKILLRDKLNIPIESILIVENQYGKKKCKNSLNVHFNISHSGKWVVIAFSEYEVGVDIEEMLGIEFNEVIPFFTYEEQEYLNSLKEDKKLGFYRMWTAKESYMKYTGLGFNLDLNSFSVPLQENGEVKSKDCTTDKRPLISSFLLDENYYISVCSNQVTKKNIIYINN